MGDEICCRSAACWETGYAPVAQKLRALLGPDALLYMNECGKPKLWLTLSAEKGGLKVVPKGLSVGPQARTGRVS